jgi:hypothetical protein
MVRTALHWAAKRNQLDVAHCLLTNGADKTMESFAKETPADLSTSPAVLNLLGSPMTKEKPEESDKNEITPHYLAHLNSGYKVDLQEHSRISMPLPHGRDVVHKKGKRNNWIQIVILFIATNLLLSFS